VERNEPTNIAQHPKIFRNVGICVVEILAMPPATIMIIGTRYNELALIRDFFAFNNI
jgi:hypothetical protein